MQRESPVHENILDNMSDGVLTVDLEGRVMTFNPAAAQLLGMAREAVLGRPLAQALLHHQGLDAFNQAILDTVYRAENGESGRGSHRKKIEAQIEGERRFLELTTSYLREPGREPGRGQGGQAHGQDGGMGVIVLFSDITEVERLREAESELSQALETQHGELQSAYRDLEDSNQNLASALKQAQRLRLAATGFVIVLFLAVGLVVWRQGAPEVPDSSAPPSPAAAGEGGGSTLVVVPQRLRATILLAGKVAPRNEVQVTSPIAGKVTRLHFQYGERITQGQRLVDLDTAEAEGERRTAQAAYIKTLQRFNALADWPNNVEVTNARQALSKAALALEIQKSALDQSAFLLEQGVVSANQHEATKRQYHSQQLDHESSRRALESVLAKGGPDAKRVAELELDNARMRLAALDETLRGAAIDAPISGVALEPSRASGDKGSLSFASGEQVAQGDPLLTIGDVDSLAVVGSADEVDVVKISEGQRVSIRGDAFPDLEIQGAITHVSQQAHPGGGHSGPSFRVVAVMEGLSAEQRGQLRLGMSATLEVVVRDRPDALLVPIGAVRVRGNGEAWLRVRDEDGEVRSVQVEAGMTTLDSVEILSGLKAGDAVLLAGARHP